LRTASEDERRGWDWEQSLLMLVRRAFGETP
jgi:hypothetical protein